MSLTQEVKFKRKDYEKTRDIIPVSLNKEERALFDSCKELLQQNKDSTAMKQLMEIAAIVIQDKKTRTINDIITNNKRKNKRLGIIDFD